MQPIKSAIRDVYRQSEHRGAASPTLRAILRRIQARLRLASPEGSVTLQELEALGRAMHLRNGSRLLDLAGGNGRMALALARQYAVQIVGMDLMQDRVRAAQRRFKSETHLTALWLQADASAHLPLDAEGVDAVLFVDALVHIKDKARLLGEIRRVLNDRGRLALVTICGTRLTGQEARVLEETTASFFRIELEDLLRLVEQAGLQIEVVRDRSPAFRAWHTARLEAFRRSSATLQREVGRELDRVLEREQTIVELATRGVLTSALVVGKRTAGQIATGRSVWMRSPAGKNINV